MIRSAAWDRSWADLLRTVDAGVSVFAEALTAHTVTMVTAVKRAMVGQDFLANWVLTQGTLEIDVTNAAIVLATHTVFSTFSGNTLHTLFTLRARETWITETNSWFQGISRQTCSVVGADIETDHAIVENTASKASVPLIAGTCTGNTSVSRHDFIA